MASTEPDYELRHEHVGSVHVTGIVGLDNVRMAEPADGRHFPDEAGHGPLVTGACFREHFDRGGSPACGM